MSFSFYNVAVSVQYIRVPCCVFPVLFPHRTMPPDEVEEEDGAGHIEGTLSEEEGAGEVAVTERRQLVRYLARKTGGEVAFLDFEGGALYSYHGAMSTPLD